MVEEVGVGVGVGVVEEVVVLREGVVEEVLDGIVERGLDEVVEEVLNGVVEEVEAGDAVEGMDDRIVVEADEEVVELDATAATAELVTEFGLEIELVRLCCAIVVDVVVGLWTVVVDVLVGAEEVVEDDTVATTSIFVVGAAAVLPESMELELVVPKIAELMKLLTEARMPV